MITGYTAGTPPASSGGQLPVDRGSSTRRRPGPVAVLLAGHQGAVGVGQVFGRSVAPGPWLNLDIVQGLKQRSYATCEVIGGGVEVVEQGGQWGQGGGRGVAAGRGSNSVDALEAGWCRDGCGFPVGRGRRAGLTPALMTGRSGEPGQGAGAQRGGVDLQVPPRGAGRQYRGRSRGVTQGLVAAVRAVAGERRCACNGVGEVVGCGGDRELESVDPQGERARPAPCRVRVARQI